MRRRDHSAVNSDLPGTTFRRHSKCAVTRDILIGTTVGDTLPCTVNTLAHILPGSSTDGTTEYDTRSKNPGTRWDCVYLTLYYRVFKYMTKHRQVLVRSILYLGHINNTARSLQGRARQSCCLVLWGNIHSNVPRNWLGLLYHIIRLNGQHHAFNTRHDKYDNVISYICTWD